MQIIDKEIILKLKQEFTPLKSIFKKFIQDNNLNNANLVCWVPHEVSSIVQIGWEEGLLEDLKDFLNEVCPSEKYKNHDEPNTVFRYNAHEHIQTKLIGDISKTFIVKDGELYIGKYQDLYFYSPVWQSIPNQKIFCRILKFD